MMASFRAPIPCAFCGTRLHFFADCPVRSQLLASSPPRLVPIPCNFCGTRKHFSTDCPLCLQQLNSVEENLYDLDDGYYEYQEYDEDEEYYKEEFYEEDDEVPISFDEEPPYLPKENDKSFEKYEELEEKETLVENYYDEYQEHNEDKEYHDDEILDEELPGCLEIDMYKELYVDDEDYEEHNDKIYFDEGLSCCVSDTENTSCEEIEGLKVDDTQPIEDFLISPKQEQQNWEANQLHESAKNQHIDEFSQPLLHCSSQDVLVQENHSDIEYLQSADQLKHLQNLSEIEQENLLFGEDLQQQKPPFDKLVQLSQEVEILPEELAVLSMENQPNQQALQPENELILQQTQPSFLLPLLHLFEQKDQQIQSSLLEQDRQLQMLDAVQKIQQHKDEVQQLMDADFFLIQQVLTTTFQQQQHVYLVAKIVRLDDDVSFVVYVVNLKCKDCNKRLKPTAYLFFCFKERG